MIVSKIFAAIAFAAALAFLAAACASDPGGEGGSPRPEWTLAAGHPRYDSAAYLTAVGAGGNRRSAEADALTQLASIFAVNINHSFRETAEHSEFASGDASISVHRQTLSIDLATSTSRESLAGARIGGAWSDGRGGHYALAVLCKATAGQVYSERVRANQETISALTAGLAAAERRNTLEGFFRYMRAAELADLNVIHGEVLAAVGDLRRDLANGEDFRIRAREIAWAIPPIGIAASGDSGRRIQDAFAGVFSSLGLRTASGAAASGAAASMATGARYALEVRVGTRSDAADPRGRVFSDVAVSAILFDAGARAELSHFSFASRNGDWTQQGAEGLAFRDAERRIAREYRAHLSSFLTPGR